MTGQIKNRDSQHLMKLIHHLVPNGMEKITVVHMMPCLQFYSVYGCQSPRSGKHIQEFQSISFYIAWWIPKISEWSSVAAFLEHGKLVFDKVEDIKNQGVTYRAKKDGPTIIWIISSLKSGQKTGFVAGQLSGHIIFSPIGNPLVFRVFYTVRYFGNFIYFTSHAISIS